MCFPSVRAETTVGNTQMPNGAIACLAPGRLSALTSETLFAADILEFQRSEVDDVPFYIIQRRCLSLPYSAKTHNWRLKL